MSNSTTSKKRYLLHLTVFFSSKTNILAIRMKKRKIHSLPYLIIERTALTVLALHINDNIKSDINKPNKCSSTLESLISLKYFITLLLRTA